VTSALPERGRSRVPIGRVSRGERASRTSLGRYRSLLGVRSGRRTIFCAPSCRGLEDGRCLAPGRPLGTRTLLLKHPAPTAPDPTAEHAIVVGRAHKSASEHARRRAGDARGCPRASSSPSSTASSSSASCPLPSRPAASCSQSRRRRRSAAARRRHRRRRKPRTPQRSPLLLRLLCPPHPRARSTRPVFARAGQPGHGPRGRPRAALDDGRPDPALGQGGRPGPPPRVRRHARGAGAAGREGVVRLPRRRDPRRADRQVEQAGLGGSRAAARASAWRRRRPRSPPLSCKLAADWFQ
jgi:hypothetical protein